MPDLRLIRVGDSRSVQLQLETPWLILRKRLHMDVGNFGELPEVVSGDLLHDPGLKPGLPKIPDDLARQVFGTMKAVHTEVFFSLWRSIDDGTWEITWPSQDGKAARVDYEEEDIDDPMFQLVGTLHSHPGFGPYFSGTDLRDHKRNGNKIHFVYAFDKRTGAFEGMDAVAMVKGCRFDISWATFFESSAAEEATVNDANPDWVSRCAELRQAAREKRKAK